MPTYIVIGNFTEQGIRNVKDSPGRAAAFQAAAARRGVQIKAVYWTMGKYDVVLIAEAADDATISAALLSVAALGNITTQTLRAFEADEMKGILDKME